MSMSARAKTPNNQNEAAARPKPFSISGHAIELSPRAHKSAFVVVSDKKTADKKQSASAFNFEPRAAEKAQAARTKRFTAKAQTPKPTHVRHETHLALPLARRSSMPTTADSKHTGGEAVAAHHNKARSSGAMMLSLMLEDVAQSVNEFREQGRVTFRADDASPSPINGIHTPRRSPAILPIHDETPVVHENPHLLPDDDYDPVANGQQLAPAPKQAALVTLYDTEEDMRVVAHGFSP